MQGETGAKGDKGDQGEQGIQGIEGLQGVPGSPGADGDNGASAYDVAVANGCVSADDPEMACTPEEWLASLVGPQGTAGANGSNGTDGTQGTQGLPGVKGDTGAVGPEGQQGPKGDKGDTGATGAAGPQGLKGDKGDTGAAGTNGTNGATGATGAIVENGSSLALVQPSGTTTTYFVFLGANTNEPSVQQPSPIAGTVVQSVRAAHGGARNRTHLDSHADEERPGHRGHLRCGQHGDVVL